MTDSVDSVVTVSAGRPESVSDSGGIKCAQTLRTIHRLASEGDVAEEAAIQREEQELKEQERIEGEEDFPGYDWTGPPGRTRKWFTGSKRPKEVRRLNTR